MVTVNVVMRGSHRRAVHQHATLPPCPFTVRGSICPGVSSRLLSVRSKLIAGASWTVALMSSLSEYGLGENFPLTPVLWEVIALTVTLTAIGPGRMLPPSGLANHGGFLTVKSSPPHVRAGTVYVRAEMDDGSQLTHAEDLALGSACPIQRTSGEVVATAHDVALGLTPLNPATNRGPPSGGLQTYSSSRSPRYYCCFLQSHSPPNPQSSGRPS
jgi:hypothetical protein